MSIIAIILSIILEQQKLLFKVRKWFIHMLEQYISVFTKRDLNTQRSIRLTYVFACVPIILILLTLKLYHHYLPFLKFQKTLLPVFDNRVEPFLF